MGINFQKIRAGTAGPIPNLVQSIVNNAPEYADWLEFNGSTRTPQLAMGSSIANLPYFLDNNTVRMGSQWGVMANSYVASGSNAEPQDMFNGLGHLIGTRGARLSAVNPEHFGHKLEKEIRKWKATYWGDINAAGGIRSIGKLGAMSRQGLLFFDDGGRRAQELQVARKQFMNAVLGNHQGNRVAAVDRYVNFFTSTLAEALKVTAGGRAVNIHGIKEAAFQMLKRYDATSGQYVKDTALRVNIASPDEYQAFGHFGNVIKGEYHASDFIATKTSKGAHKGAGSPFAKEIRAFSNRELHPLVRTAKYAEDLQVMSRLQGLKTTEFGTVMRVDTGFLTGGKTGMLWQAIGGDSGGVLTSGRSALSAADTTREYTRSLRGISGMTGLPDGTLQLSDELMALEGMKELLADKKAAGIDFTRKFKGGRGYKMGSEVLGRYNSGTKITAMKGSYLERVERVDKGLRFVFSDSARTVREGTGVLLNDVRGTIGVGAKLHKIDYLTHASYAKLDNPRAYRKAILSHYASRVLGLKNSTEKDIGKRFQALAELTGTTASNIRGIGWGLDTSNADGYLNNLTVDQFESQFGRPMVEKLASRLGVSPEDLLPKVEHLTIKQAVQQMTSAGRMSRKDAFAFIRKHGIKSSDLPMIRLEGQDLKFRGNWFQEQGFRVRGKEARNILNMLTDVRADVSSDAASSIDDLRSILGGNIRGLERRVKGIVAGLNAPIYGQAGIDKLLATKGGQYNRVSLSSLRDKAYFAELKGKLDEGFLTPEDYKDLLARLGQNKKGNLGTFIDVGEEIGVHNGSRAAGAARNANTFFLPNLNEIIPELRGASTTGAAGDILRFPRNVLNEGFEKSTYGSINTRAALMNLVESIMDPNYSHGALSKRIMLAAMGVTESLVGSKGTISRGHVKGFVGARLRTRQLGTLGVGEIGLSAKGISKHFYGDIGEQMLADLRAGKDVFAFMGRDPIQTTQQEQVVKVKLLNQRRKANGNYIPINSSDIDTVFVGIDPMRAAQGDHDTDYVKTFLFSKRHIKYTDQQKALGAIYQSNYKNMEVFRQLLENQINAADKSAGNPADDLFRALAGGDANYGKMASAFGEIDEFARAYGYKGELTPEIRQAYGAMQPEISHKAIAMADAYAQKQIRYINALSGGTSSFNVPPSEIAKLMENTGIKNARMAQQADQLRIIYGLLKKGGKNARGTMAIIDALESMKTIAPDTPQYEALRATMAENLQKIAPGMSQSGTAHFAFRDKEAFKYAQEAAAKGLGGIEDPTYYGSVADKMLRFARAGAVLEQAGYTTTGALTKQRQPRGFIGSLMEEMLEMPVTNQAGYAPGTEALRDAALEFSDGIDASTVESTATKASSGLGRALSEGSTLIHDTAKKAFGGEWGNMKAFGIGAAVAGGALMLSSSGGRDAPDYTEELPPGPSVPPTPILGEPNDGIYNAPIARGNRNARIERVTGQRRHFGTIDDVSLSGPINVMDGFMGQEGPLSRANLTPTTLTQSRASRANRQDF